MLEHNQLLAVLAYCVGLTLLTEVAQYLLVYRTSNFKTLKANLEKHSKKLDEAKSGAQSKNLKKKQARLETWQEAAGRQIVSINWKTGTVVSRRGRAGGGRADGGSSPCGVAGAPLAAGRVTATAQLGHCSIEPGQRAYSRVNPASSRHIGPCAGAPLNSAAKCSAAAPPSANSGQHLSALELAAPALCPAAPQAMIVLISGFKFLNNMWGGQVVGRLPFEPIPFFAKITHRGLEGPNITDCSAVSAAAGCGPAAGEPHGGANAGEGG